MRIRNIDVGLNKVIRTLIAFDFLLQSGWGLIGPIFAIFLTQQIKGGTLAAVGFIAATYWVTKSISQPFIAYSFDLKKGEKDDFKFLFWGMVVASLIPLGYIFANQIWHIFLLEFIRGLAMACVVPAWAGIFTRHIDKGWEAYSWSIDSAFFGLGGGLAAAFGGIIATFLGFKIIFVLVGLFGLAAAFVLLSIRNKIFSRDRISTVIIPPEKKLQ